MGLVNRSLDHLEILDGSIADRPGSLTPIASAMVGSGSEVSLSVGSPLQPDVEIVLEPPAADPDASPADKQAMAELLAKGVLRGVIFSTTDCDALFERVRASGAEVLQEPADQPYGLRDCAFRDPAGNLLRFAENRRAG